MQNKIAEDISDFFKKYFTQELKSISLLPASGSMRKYYRIIYVEPKTNEQRSILGVFNKNILENKAFIDYALQLKNTGIKVPEIICIADEFIYFIEDLGDTTLFNLIQDYGFNDRVKKIYYNLIDELIKIQCVAGARFDYSKAYPTKYFDKRAIGWDLNYFKYSFLKLSGIAFNEDALENDFERILDLIYSEKDKFFVFRDFQSRNVMIKDDEIFFIDFQGGRKGALAYDLASLLYDAKADLPDSFRTELLNLYIEKISSLIPTDKDKFKQSFYLYTIVRILQAMGAYGLKGFFEKKSLFLKSIPYAIKNLNSLLSKKDKYIGLELSEIKRIINFLSNSSLSCFNKIKSNKLRLYVNSFSFKKDFPKDKSGNGGGFVFDCRGLPNPGRLDMYKQLTGKDKAVIDYLWQHSEVDDFINNCIVLVKPSIINYIEREFESLQINFGCTGGQHRSVYCTEEFCKRIYNDFDIEIICKHTVFPNI